MGNGVRGPQVSQSGEAGVKEVPGTDLLLRERSQVKVWKKMKLLTIIMVHPGKNTT